MSHTEGDRTESLPSSTVGGPYQNLRVIDLSDNPAGDLTAKFLAGMGADVLKIEPPGGSPLRRWASTSFEDRDRASAPFDYYNLNKRSAVCDPTSSDDLQRLDDLLDQADVLITTLTPPQLSELNLDLRELVERVPRLIVISLTAFGLDGPRAGWVASDLVSLALGGLLNSCGYDDRSIPPIRPGENQAFHCAASFGHIGLLLALIDRDRSGRGQLVDISIHESVYVNVELANPYWFYPKALIHRQTCRHAQPAPTQPALFRCLDDRFVYFALILGEEKPWSALVRWLDKHGMAADLSEPEYADSAVRQRNYSHIYGILEAFFLVNPSEQMYREGQEFGLPIGVLNSPADVLRDRHSRARGFFYDMQLSDNRSVAVPVVPMHFSSWSTPKPTRAPRLGEHRMEFRLDRGAVRVGG